MSDGSEEHKDNSPSKIKSPRQSLTLIATTYFDNEQHWPDHDKAERLWTTSANPPPTLIRAHRIMRSNQLRAKWPTAASPWSKTPPKKPKLKMAAAYAATPPLEASEATGQHLEAALLLSKSVR